MDSLRAIAALIKQEDDFLLIAHVSPDGDTLGSVLALARAIEALGKRVESVCADPVPHIYAFLPGAEAVRLPGEAKPARVAIAVDCADAQRLGDAYALFEAAQFRCNIDHHITNTQYAHMNCADARAAATGELIYALIRMLGAGPDAEASDCLYAALISDTGNFAYSNTTPETLRIAADLMERGADNTRVNRLLYRTIPYQKQKLLGAALADLTLYEEGKISLSLLERAQIEACGASDEDAEGIIDHIRDIEGVELALLIRAAEPGAYRVSLRSKLYADVGAIAKLMGGGGHKHAAGYTAHGAADEVLHEALAHARDAVRA